jgi:hypothetical protein
MMRRPSLVVWALPAAVALGLLVGLRLRPDVAAVSSAQSPVAVSSPAPAIADPSAETTPDSVPSVFGTGPAAAALDSAVWGAGGGAYQPLAPDPRAATLPAAPEAEYDLADAGSQDQDATAVYDATPAGRPAPGPAQELGREAALRRPLIAVGREGGRLSFYSAWEAEGTRASLVGEWGAVNACRPTVRVAYEQVVAGLGAVRGSGSAGEPPAWTIALVVPRQHCAAASARWRGSRSPAADEAAMVSAALGGDRPTALVREGDRIWATSEHRAVVGRAVGGRLLVEWSEHAPEGATARLLGVWEGDGLFVAIDGGGRLARVWRASP